MRPNFAGAAGPAASTSAAAGGAGRSAGPEHAGGGRRREPATTHRFRANPALAGDAIVPVGPAEPAATEVLDAAGMTLAPDSIERQRPLRARPAGGSPGSARGRRGSPTTGRLGEHPSAGPALRPAVDDRVRALPPAEESCRVRGGDRAEIEGKDDRRPPVPAETGPAETVPEGKNRRGRTDGSAPATAASSSTRSARSRGNTRERRAHATLGCRSGRTAPGSLRAAGRRDHRASHPTGHPPREETSAAPRRTDPVLETRPPDRDAPTDRAPDEAPSEDPATGSERTPAGSRRPFRARWRSRSGGRSPRRAAAGGIGYPPRLS